MCKRALCHWNTSNTIQLDNFIQPDSGRAEHWFGFKFQSNYFQTESPNTGQPVLLINQCSSHFVNKQILQGDYFVNLLTLYFQLSLAAQITY